MTYYTDHATCRNQRTQPLQTAMTCIRANTNEDAVELTAPTARTLRQQLTASGKVQWNPTWARVGMEYVEGTKYKSLI